MFIYEQYKNMSFFETELKTLIRTNIIQILKRKTISIYIKEN